MTWFIWAVFASFCAAAMAECNRIFRLDAQMINAWRSTFAVALLAFAFPQMTWAHAHAFYGVAILDGAVTAIGMVMFFYLAARRTGRVSSMILPMAAFGAYVTWWMMYPLERPTLTEEPFHVLLAVLSFALVTFSFQKLRDNDASWDSFIIVLPVGLAFGVIDTLNKDVLGHSYNVYGAALAYTFLALAVCAVVSWVAAIPRPLGGRPCGFFDSKLLWGGFWCGFWTAGMTLASTFALSTAPNPTLPGLIMALTPLWLFALNHFRQVDDEVSTPAGVLLLAGTAGLLISTL
jgi:hypothetical protein